MLTLGECVQKNRICDNVADCSNGEDEKHCEGLYLLKTIPLLSCNNPPIMLLLGDKICIGIIND